jgi:asparagine synthase (glutamine-hydrolysing)
LPGISGIISKISGGKNKQDIRLMIDCIVHESYYTSGTYINEKLGIYVGWACHRDSFSDCMPLVNESGDIILIFSGENFVDKKIYQRLKKHNHEFDRSNASYLIHLYEEEEDNFFRLLNGWFSGVIIDLRKENVVLFNDRFGMQRIYFYEGKDEFIFSSEAKSLLRVRKELRNIDPTGLGQFFTYGCIINNRTLFSDICLLPGGSSWIFHKSNLIKKAYFFKQSAWQNQPILEGNTFYEELRNTFLKILPNYFNSKDIISLSLTGGLDTRMILSCMDVAPGKVPCYTFGGIYRDSYDVRIARKVAAICKQTHHVLKIDRKFLSEFPYYAEKTIYITDGCHNVCGSHDLFLNRLAREISPIRMTGKFGGEVLRSVSAFAPSALCENLFHPDFKKYIKEAVNDFDDIRKGDRLSFAVFKEMPWHMYGCLALEQSQLTIRTPFMDNNIVGLMYQAPDEVHDKNEISLKIIRDGNTDLFNTKTDLGFGGRSNFLFSKSIQLFYWILFKAEWYYNLGMPHWLEKINNTSDFLNLEHLILGHHKIENYRIWFRNEVSTYVQEILLDKRSGERPYLNTEFMEKMVNNHIKGTHNYVHEIDKILTVELIHRLLIENI